MSADSTTPNADALKTDLDAADLDGVSGGLNPQPLPPIDGGGDVHVNPVGVPKLVR